MVLHIEVRELVNVLCPATLEFEICSELGFGEFGFCAVEFLDCCRMRDAEFVGGDADEVACVWRC